MSSYFKKYPAVDYFFGNEGLSNKVENIAVFSDVIDQIRDATTSYHDYYILPNERPDQVSSRFYNDPALDWVVLTTNNIIHLRDEWPMGSQDFLTYLNAKYTTQQLSNIHHYETKILRNSRGQLVQKGGITVPEGHSVTFLDNGVIRTESQITSFTFLEHETKLNDDKRNINVLRQEYLSVFLDNFAEIMEYKPSNQFVRENLKKTENPRLISP